MNITIQDGNSSQVSADSSSNDFVSENRAEITTSDVAAQATQLIQTFQPQRFAIGLLCTTAGVALILSVGFFMEEMQDAGGDLMLPMTGILILFGVTLLGGGFAVMATSSSGFDEQEFDRLATAGNISAVNDVERSNVDSTEHSGCSRINNGD